MQKLPTLLVSIAMAGCASSAQAQDVPSSSRALEGDELGAVLKGSRFTRPWYSLQSADNFHCEDEKYLYEGHRLNAAGRYRIKKDQFCIESSVKTFCAQLFHIEGDIYEYRRVAPDMGGEKIAIVAGKC